jgi:hypothetical protein
VNRGGPYRFCWPRDLAARPGRETWPRGGIRPERSRGFPDCEKIRGKARFRLEYFRGYNYCTESHGDRCTCFPNRKETHVR